MMIQHTILTRQQHSSRRRLIQAAEVNCLNHPALIPSMLSKVMTHCACLIWWVTFSLYRKSSHLCYIVPNCAWSSMLQLVLEAKSAIIPRCLAFLLASSLCHHMVAWKTGLTYVVLKMRFVIPSYNQIWILDVIFICQSTFWNYLPLRFLMPSRMSWH